ncbi:MAG: hypothetical protein RBS78_01030 [Coriobacteriia bacterium]|jgi:hypothetical protein|nr:hypothetical protein [Coriobacteriia bacterium]
MSFINDVARLMADYPDLLIGQPTVEGGVLNVMPETLALRAFQLIQPNQSNPLYSGEPLPCIDGQLIMRNYPNGAVYDVEADETIVLSVDGAENVGHYSQLVSDFTISVPSNTGMRAMNGSLFAQNFFPLWRKADGSYVGQLRGKCNDFGDTLANMMEDQLGHLGTWDAAGNITGHKTMTMYPYPGMMYTLVGAEKQGFWGASSGSGGFSGYCTYFLYDDESDRIIARQGSNRGNARFEWDAKADVGNFNSGALLMDHGFISHPMWGGQIYGQADEGHLKSHYWYRYPSITSGFQGIQCYVHTLENSNQHYLTTQTGTRRLLDVERDNAAEPLARISRDGADAFLGNSGAFRRDVGVQPNGMTWWSCLSTSDIDTEAASIPSYFAEPSLVRFTANGQLIHTRFTVHPDAVLPEGYQLGTGRPTRVWMVGNKVHVLYAINPTSNPALTGAYAVAIGLLPDAERYVASPSLLPIKSVPDISFRLRRGGMSNLINGNMEVLNNLLVNLADAATPDVVGPIDANGHSIKDSPLPARPLDK